LTTLSEIDFTVEDADDRCRLDAVLCRQSGESRAFVQAQIDLGHVSVNATIAVKASQKLRPGDRVRAQFDIVLPAPALAPVAGPLEILFEDESLLAVNKAQGVVVHPAAGHRGDTLVHYLLHHLATAPAFRELSLSRPGIVHRLDRGTSGVLLVAKSRAAQENIAQQFKSRTIRKEYEAIVWGRPPIEGRFDSPIGRDRVNRKKMSSRTESGRSALTSYRTTRGFAHFAHLALFPHTGRTHQLRVHLAEARYPIVGDALYGGAFSPKRAERLGTAVRQELAAARETFLHARQLILQHPSSGETLVVQAPRPENFDRLLAALAQEDRR
jgi:23S rRNA pseudouridine1911/1915/1917 synthase